MLKLFVSMQTCVTGVLTATVAPRPWSTACLSG
jgi:hypothetical protein